MSISGNGSTTLTYAAAPASWTSGCSNGLLYKLLCTGGQVELRVIYFTTGSCPTGTQQYCSNLRVTPYGLTLSSYTCSPFSMTFLSKSAALPGDHQQRIHAVHDHVVKPMDNGQPITDNGQRCIHCPTPENLRCGGLDVRRFCELIDPSCPQYDSGYREVIVREARMP